jgi:hypothetical protein
MNGTQAARAVLLRASAAAAAARPATTGRYWVVGSQDVYSIPAGPASHPYDIATRIDSQEWYPRSAGQKFWDISRFPGDGPVSPADIAAWRAAGAPQSWEFGSPKYGSAEQVYNLHGSPGTSNWNTQTSNEVTDEVTDTDPRGTQTFRFSGGEASVRATLSAIARRFGDDMFTNGTAILAYSPLSPHVRSELFRVLASLPGVTNMGTTTDLLGRRGDEIASGGYAGYRQVAVINPSTGQILAIEYVVATPGWHRIQNDASECDVFTRLNLTPQERAVQEARIGHLCKQLAKEGTRYVQYGTQYQGQIVDATMYTRAEWTNSTPSASVTGGTR